MTTLVVGPSLGTTVASCWGPTLALLDGRLDGPPGGLEVVGLELPGHADPSGPVPDDLTVGDLAAQVLAQVEGPFVYAGDSVGGQVGLQLLLDAPERVLGAVLCCTGARIGTDQTWTERVAQVRAGGTASLVGATAERWFAPGFLERQPDRGSALLHTLRDASDEGYVAVCGALSRFDVRARLAEIERPVVAVAGAVDPVCPPDLLREIADGVQHGRLVVLDDVAHQAPAEAPDVVAGLVRDLVAEVAA